jgi:hypothetical protein
MFNSTVIHIKAYVSRSMFYNLFLVDFMNWLQRLKTNYEPSSKYCSSKNLELKGLFSL